MRRLRKPYTPIPYGGPISSSVIVGTKKVKEDPRGGCVKIPNSKIPTYAAIKYFGYMEEEGCNAF